MSALVLKDQLYAMHGHNVPEVLAVDADSTQCTPDQLWQLKKKRSDQLRQASGLCSDVFTMDWTD